MDTTGRRLSQIPHKLNYPYPLPNGHSALQLRLPDLLIYLKTDTYLIDVNTGDHYAVYSDRIEKMSISPKLYSAWGYRQLLQMIQNDAIRFGVNSPVKYPRTYGQHQDRVNYLLWLSTCGHHLPRADPPLSNMNHYHSALNNLCRCSHRMNAISYCRTMLQLPMLFSIRLLF